MRIVTLALTLVLLVVGALVYHYELGAASELVQLIVVMPLLGIGLLQIFGKTFVRAESVVLATALGAGFTALFQWVSAWAGLDTSVTIVSLIAIGIVSLLASRSWQRANDCIATLLYALPFAAILVLSFNLPAFHYGVDGSIISRGLFSHDLPFLTGEIHGLRFSPHLIDLHQSGLAWNYHDATYRILALSEPSHTLDLVAWVEPIFGYTIMAIGVYAVVDRLTGNRFAAIGASALWFLSSPYWGSELTSYALSPSFVFGSIILLALIVAVHEYLLGRSMRIGALVLVLLVALARFKISTFLVAGPAIGIVALMMLRRDTKAAIVLGGSAVIALLQLLLFGAPVSRLMPANDFVIGAPLLGYANHVAKLLHTSVAAISPVTHGGIALRSLLILPYFLFHLVRLVGLDLRVLVGVLVGVFVVRQASRTAWTSLTSQTDERIIWILLIAIPVGYLLPVLYSPAWYALALSFYAPLVSAQAAVILLGIGFDLLLTSRAPKWLRVAVPIAAIVGIGFGLHGDSRALAEKPFVVSSELLTVLEDLSAVKDHSTLATRRFDLDPTDTKNDESFYWYAALSGHPVISEGAKYGSLLAAVADVDSAKGLHPVPAALDTLRAIRGDLAAIYYSGDTAVVFNDLRRHHVRFVLERLGPGTPDERLHVDLSAIGLVAYHSGNTRIWAIR